MEIVATPQALRRQLAEQPTGPGGLAFVPTMGNLHDGHLSLVRKALDSADTVAVSIFVNPMQFADGEDLEAYPRTLDRDIELLTETGADLYRMRTDDTGRLQCVACHGATHATYPALNTKFGADRDNIQPLQYQGNRRPIGAEGNCKVCHVIDMEDSIHHPGMDWVQ